MIGVLNINKPKRVTSSQVVCKVKKLLNTGKVGHMGTLDPLASGVLPICVGRATRLFDYFLKKQKTYIANFTFGTQTDTLDLEGQVIKTSNNIPTKQQVEEAIKTFIGTTNQVPPMYSSKKIDGKKAYDLARNGTQINLKSCPITIYEYKLLNQVDKNTFEFKITCSAGTYIRALARDLGEQLNSCATMTSLIRTKAGNFSLDNAINYDNLTKETLISNLIPLNTVLADFEKIAIPEQDFQKLLNGLTININSLKLSNVNNDFNQNLQKDIMAGEISPSNQKYYAITMQSQIVGIGYIYNNNLKIKTYLLDN